MIIFMESKYAQIDKSRSFHLSIMSEKEMMLCPRLVKLDKTHIVKF